MNRIVNFMWVSSARVPQDADLSDDEQYKAALDQAWAQVQKSDGDICDDFNEPEDKPQNS